MRLDDLKVGVCAFFAVCAGALWAGNPPDGKTVLWDEAEQTLRITYENATGSLGSDFWITNRVYDATTLESISEAEMATKKVARFVVDITNATLRAWLRCVDAAPFEVDAPVFDIVNGTLDVWNTAHMFDWGYYINYSRPQTTFHVRENATMSFRNEAEGVCNYLYLGPGALVLHGGRVVQPPLTTVASSSPVFENRDASQNANALRVMGVIRAVASAKASVMTARRISLDTYCSRYPCIFDVEEGAVLELDAEIIDNSRGGKPSPSGFVKRGKGRLVLKRPSPMTGVISVEEGTLAVAEGASLPNLALLEVYADAQVELAPGVPPIRAPRINVPAAVRKAVVRVDATRYWGNGSGGDWDYSGLYNLGTSGGAFSRSSDRNALTFSPGLFRGPDWPAFRMNWVDYTLTGFSNPSHALTLVYSMRHVPTTGRDEWRGVYSIYNSVAQSEGQAWNANNDVATFRLEMPNTNSVATVYDARYIQYRGTWGETSLKNDRGRPYDEAYVDCLVLSNLTASTQKFVWEQHFTNDIQRTEQTLSGYDGALNHDTFRLGTRPRDRASCNHQAFGELMMFCGDALSPQELADVKTYLKTKWLGAHVPNAGDGAEGVTEFDVPAGRVDVAQGASARAVKRGEGTLELDSVTAVAADLAVEAGTLAFVSKGTPSKAQVWADFGDGGSLTTNAAGTVLSLRNKGALGGTFNQTSMDPQNYGTLVSSGAGRPDVMRCRWSTYDFLDDRLMPSDKDNLTAIVVFKPQTEQAWNDMFALLPGEEVMKDESQTFAPRLYFEAGKDSPFFVVYRNEENSDIASAGLSAVNAHTLAELKDTFAILGTEMPPERQVLYFAETELDANTNKLVLTWASAACARSFGGVRLGGRPDARVTTQSWWDGDIAEAMVFNTSLTDAERTAVMDYLRAKWYRGEAVTAPTVLTGTPAPARAPGGALTLADGVTVEIDGESVVVDRLTVPAGAVVTLDPGELDRTTDDGRELIEFADGAVAGSFALPASLRATWKVRVRDGVVSLAYNSGFSVILR
ncbi:MAG: hypothetical protein ACI4Q3_10720 [Kiritimatiellia bacterium]